MIIRHIPMKSARLSNFSSLVNYITDEQNKQERVKLSYASPEFELRTLNDNWPNIKVADGLKIDIIGKVLQRISSY